MNELPSGDVTMLLQAWSDGDKRALDELIPIVYTEIHCLAHSYLRREPPGQKLQPDQQDDRLTVRRSKSVRCCDCECHRVKA